MIVDHPKMVHSQPFEFVPLYFFLRTSIYMLKYLNRIKIKQMQLAYGIEKVFNEDIPNLQHGNDGLIYTCLHTPYVAGTDHNMYVSSFAAHKTFLYSPVRLNLLTQIEMETSFRKLDRL